MAGKLERIDVFIRVAEMGSFAAAARDLGLSRSYVTRYVTDLERSLGEQLIVRTTRKLSLTSAGRLYLEQTKPILAALNRADQLIEQTQEILTGELHISAPISFGQLVLPDLLHEFHLAYPLLGLKCDLSDQFVDLIDGGYDLSLRISGPPSGVSNIWRKIAHIPRVIVASPAYLASHGSPKHARELAKHIQVGYAHDLDHFRLKLSLEQDVININTAPAFLLNNGEVVADLVAKGRGITILPKFLVADYLTNGELLQVLP